MFLESNLLLHILIHPVSAPESREAGLDQGHGEVHLALGRGRRGRGEVREDGVQCGQTAQGRPPPPGDQATAQS